MLKNVLLGVIEESTPFQCQTRLLWWAFL